MADLVSKTTYLSGPHTSKFRIEGSSGHYDRTDSQNVKRWIKENSIAESRSGEDLVFDGTILLRLKEEMVSLNPPYPNRDEKYTYKMQLTVAASPRNRIIFPEGLVRAIMADCYVESEKSSS